MSSSFQDFVEQIQKTQSLHGNLSLFLITANNGKHHFPLRKLKREGLPRLSLKK